MIFEHVIFDLDGTLIDSRVDLAAAVNHALRTLQLAELSVETICGYVGAGARRLVQRALGAAHQDRLKEALALFMAFYPAHLLDHTRAYPGVDAMIEALVAMGVTLSVLSNKPAAMSRAILAGLDLLRCFVVVLGGDSFPERKPEPAGIDYVCNLTHMPRARLLMVGDSAIDAQTARAARVAFCGVAWGLAPASLRAANEPIIDRPSELLAIVERGFY